MLTRLRISIFKQENLAATTSMENVQLDGVNNVAQQMGPTGAPFFKAGEMMKVLAITGYKPFELGIFKQDDKALYYIKKPSRTG